MEQNRDIGGGVSWPTFWYSALVSLVLVLAAEGFRYGLRVWFPVTQDYRQVPMERTYHLERLCDNMAPFVYTADHTHNIDERRGGFLNLETLPPVYIYTISLLNASTERISGIDITLEYDGPAIDFRVAAKSHALKISPTKNIDVGYVLTRKADAAPHTYTIGSLPSGKVARLQFGISAKERPIPDKLKISIVCSEGDFERITPTQWARIWQQ